MHRADLLLVEPHDLGSIGRVVEDVLIDSVLEQNRVLSVAARGAPGAVMEEAGQWVIAVGNWAVMWWSVAQDVERAGVLMLTLKSPRSSLPFFRSPYSKKCRSSRSVVDDGISTDSRL